MEHKLQHKEASATAVFSHPRPWHGPGTLKVHASITLFWTQRRKRPGAVSTVMHSIQAIVMCCSSSRDLSDVQTSNQAEDAT